ncbi:MAG: MCE family protein [Deltaproteobacteria bacterium]|nr:MCE family protein [Deltaproteobacteria bacterium]
MGKKGNPALIGAFVLGAITLAIIGITAFGSGRLFRETYTYVMYFDSDVNGLNVGAAVKFKGVEIGSVKKILLNIDSVAQLKLPGEKVLIPVVVELDADKASRHGVANVPTPAVIASLIARGLRGQLANESFVTGVLYVKLDLFPGTALKMRADESIPYPEIPTQPTPFEEVQVKAAAFFADLQAIDVNGLVEDMKTTFKTINDLAKSQGLAKALDHLDDTLGELDRTLASVRETSESTRAQIVPLSEDLRRTSSDLREVLAETGRAMSSARDILDPEAPLAVDLGKTMADVSAASRAIQRLADLLERSPDALLRGRGAPEHKP